MISSSTNTTTYNCLLSAFLLFFVVPTCCSFKDNITTGESISGTNYLESPGKMFQMGFFHLENNPERQYLGIWYSMDPKTVVWVANRNEPLSVSSFGVLTITEGGEVVVRDRNQKVYFNIAAG
ncbi:hypothetical protein QVD17_07161 [Tagetes erecta]|uniref:Bulb-type lectin domain-containing protein n=1 Tax=Tagetes erecta TaxID=13708 RepID=A0AAD8LFN4_TARER|nr:hypothetical protein QVD17_07161 [Tagetes erecta]